MRPRDSQREKLYRAEKVIQEDGLRFQTTEEIREYAFKVMRSPWTRRTFRYLAWDVQIGDGRRRRRAVACSGPHSPRWVMKFPVWSRCEAIVLHEIAHCVTGREFAAHGPEYAGTLLKLVQHFMGRECAKKLRQSFRQHHVRFRPKRKRVLTDEQRQQLRERLSLARQKKALAAALTEVIGYPPVSVG